MATTRINLLAKELGVPSKTIIEKCVAEGVPAEAVKNHMANIPAGLAASIREWFSASGGGGTATAVEATEHLDVAKVKAKATSKLKKTKSDSDDHEAPTESTADDAPAHPTQPERSSTPPVATVSAPAGPPPAALSGGPVKDDVEAPHAPAPVAGPVPVVRKIEIAPPGPSIPSGHSTSLTPPAPTSAAPAAPLSPAAPVLAQRITHPTVTAPVPPVGPLPPTLSRVSPPTAPAPVAAPGGAPGATDTPPAAPSAGPVPPASSPARPQQTVRPVFKPVMNVPTRPSIVKPAGQMLTERAKISLTGPKVVRVEQAEQVEAPRPRRPMTPGGPPRGAGVAGPARDDAARRNKRRGPGDASPIPARRRAKGGSEDVPIGTGFTEQDLAEREERLARASGLLKQRRREAKAREAAQAGVDGGPATGRVEIVAPFTIKELAAASGVKAADILKKLFMSGIMATVNSGIDPERAEEVMIAFDLDLVIKTAKTAEEVVSSEFIDRKRTDERPRAPIVTIMGHVDHGKTSLLDAIRKTNVAAGEAGGITQKTSAFRVTVEVGGELKPIVFLDTPGHQAFTEMRSRGATMTDVVVLVVGAPEGVMPQTIESINHAKAAKVPIVVALNKIDSPQATDGQIQKIMGQLAEHGLSPIEWGGQTEVVRTSATKGTGLTQLLEVLDLSAQVLELKADFSGTARGRVVEATLAEGRGAVATVLIQEGELKVGDFMVAGGSFGRVRDITDDQGKRIKTAGPAMPVQISGLDEVPDAGDIMFVADSLKKAQEAAEQRRGRDRQTALQQPKVTLDSLFSQMKDANVKEILIVLKADVQGSVDVIKNEVERLSTAEVKVRVLHSAVGGIQESDVALAEASKAVIVGFNVIPNAKARGMADQKSVEVRTYQVIYDITEDVKKAASGLLEPEIRQEILGHAEVRKVFKVTRVGTIAGCYVTDGLVQRDALIRVTRGGIVIEQDRVLEQLKRVKDDVRDVRSGMECGMKIVGYDDIKEGDVLECYKKVEVKRTL